MKLKVRIDLLGLVISALVIGLIVFFYNSSINKLRSGYNEQITEIQKNIDLLNDENQELRQNVLRGQTEYAELSQKLEETMTSLTLTEEENTSLLYEIEAMDDEIKYYEEVCCYIYNSNWDALYDDEDVRILAGVIYGENWTSGRWEMMLTGSVVLNRVMSPKFPNSIREVVYQFDGPYEQYAPRTKRLIGSDEIPASCYRLAEMLLRYGPVCPPYVLYQAHFNQGVVYWEHEGEEFCYKQEDKDAYEKSLTKED